MRYVVYTLGLLLVTLGIACTIQARLGTSPFDALLVGLSRQVGLTVGSWEIIIALLLIGCNALLQRQRPQMIGLLTACITGLGIDLWLFVLRSWLTPQVWYGQMIGFVIGMLVMGLGTAMYLHTHFAPMPIDKLTLILRELWNTNILVARTIVYAVFLLLAWSLDGPIGIGTILTVCLGGVILHWFMKRIEKLWGEPYRSQPEQHTL